MIRYKDRINKKPADVWIKFLRDLQEVRRTTAQKHSLEAKYKELKDGQYFCTVYSQTYVINVEI